MGNFHSAGVEAARRGDLNAARRLMRQALQASSGPAERGEIQRNLTEVHRRLGDPIEAVAAGQAAVRLLGRDPRALGNLGMALCDAGEDEAALACFDEVLAVAPATASAHLGRGEILLRRGDYEAGWAEYAWRARMPDVLPLIPLDVLARAGAVAWDGAPMAATLLVIADQGFGDMIQFARLLPWASTRCARLVVHAPAEIFAVLGQIPGVSALATDQQGVEPFSAWCALSELPRLAGAGWMQAAAPVPYLFAPAATRARWQAAFDVLVPAAADRLRAGLVWAGSPRQSNDFARSAPLDRLAPLGDIAAIEWVSLQKGEAASQLTAQPAAWPAQLPDVGAKLHDFAATMALLSVLDLIVTVDTSVAHLAGAMGRPVWIMLAYRADWRWGEAPTATWWYPSARLFRQPKPGDWSAVVADIIRSAGATGQ